MKLDLEKVGSIEFTGNEIDITDPSYDKNVLCREKRKIQSGHYNCYAGTINFDGDKRICALIILSESVDPDEMPINARRDGQIGVDGKIVSLYEMSGKFVVKNGLLYQKEFGPLKHEKRSKKAKRMTFLPNYPFKKRYKTFQDYADDYCGDRFHDEQNAYGYYFNPDSFWDWYRIGGRWPCSFLVKSDCLEYAVGDYDLDYELPVPPEGYAWASAARKKDIQWQAMIDYKKKSMREYFELHRKAFETQTLPEKMWLKLREDGIYTYDSFPVYLAGETFEECMKRRNYLTDTDYLMSPCYYVDADYWHSSGGISFGAERDMDEMWRKELVRFYHSLSDETVLVSVDSHE